MGKIIEAITNRLVKSLHQRISKIEKTIAAVDSMMDVGSLDTSNDSMSDTDNEILVVNVQQDNQRQPTRATPAPTTQQQPITNVISKPPNKKKQHQKQSKEIDHQTVH